MKGLLLADVFSGTTMKTVCGDETTDSKKKKRQFSMPSAGHRERLLKLVKYRWTRLHCMCRATLRIRDEVRVLLSYFSKGDYFFSERPSSP